MSDFFVPDDDVPPPGVTVQALPSVGAAQNAALETARLVGRLREKRVGWRNGSRLALVLTGLAAAWHHLPSRPRHSRRHRRGRA